MGKEENIVTELVREYLKKAGIWHFKHWSGKYSMLGISDLLGVLPDGRFLAIEVKTKGKKASKDQREFLDAINRNNGVGIVVDSLEDLIEKMKGVR